MSTLKGAGACGSILRSLEMLPSSDDFHNLSDLGFFPIPSQTSRNDRLLLLGLMRLGRSKGTYKYLEIGSFRGGSLAPFLMDAACTMILSIDDRGRVQSDERGISFDYTSITTKSMLDNLHSCGIRTDKLQTFDGSIHELAEKLTSDNKYTSSFDLAFIDGEHTDEACFRDFLWTLPLMKENSIIMFHDSTIIYKSLKLIMLYLDKMRHGYTFFKSSDSDVSALLFGDFQKISRNQYLGPEENQSIFFARAEAIRIMQQFQNRRRVRLVLNKIFKLRIPFVFDIQESKKRVIIK
jgi:predicted O-methyltransferase YrrM